MIVDPLTHQPFRCDVEPHRETVRVRLIAGPPAVRRLFDLTGTTEQFDYVDP
jgi:hypothetical protein